MRKIERLRLEALESCRLRGHTMGLFQSFDDTQKFAYCLICNKQVVINVHPAPNEIEIGGEAVALGCED